jgi:chorismate dehydratase
MTETMSKRAPNPLRVASVSFLNSRPLIYGLEQDPKIKLDLAVPSKLAGLLRDGQADVALLPVIDFQRIEGLKVVPSGGIGCDGPTLTVRIFSPCPIERIDTLGCDPDSHTSVALARIILAERHNVRPEFIDLTKVTGRPGEARLLIGDKVVCEEPRGFEHQYDLGAEWKQMTGLPFVFAVWTARDGLDLGDLPERLVRARQRGIAHVDELIERFAVPIGWPIPLARQYLTDYLRFEISDVQLRAISHFHKLAAKHGIINGLRRLNTYESESR